MPVRRPTKGSTANDDPTNRLYASLDALSGVLLMQRMLQSVLFIPWTLQSLGRLLQGGWVQSPPRRMLFPALQCRRRVPIARGCRSREGRVLCARARPYR
jgi:hypothetical protein